MPFSKFWHAWAAPAPGQDLLADLSKPERQVLEGALEREEEVKALQWALHPFLSGLRPFMSDCHLHPGFLNHVFVGIVADCPPPRFAGINRVGPTDLSISALWQIIDYASATQNATPHTIPVQTAFGVSTSL